MATITQTKETQAAISPATALQMLKDGNQRFLDKEPENRDLHAQVQGTTTGQFPYAVVLGCIDSRVPIETIFDQGIGDVFTARVAGNFVNADILGSIEYGCKVAGSKLVVVLGHTSCGAVKGACDDVKLGNVTSLIEKLKPSVAAVETPEGTDRSSGNKDFVNQVVYKNVELTIKNIYRQSPVLAEMAEDGDIDIVGAVYDITTGKIDFL
ncbi:MAG TPA: carbonic anhydrase family protein [Saprospiraceae bacterium]|nr:carbonic anhydrase family protein [Saprospiraceae bacterium]